MKFQVLSRIRALQNNVGETWGCNNAATFSPHCYPTYIQSVHSPNASSWIAASVSADFASRRVSLINRRRTRGKLSVRCTWPIFFGSIAASASRHAKNFQLRGNAVAARNMRARVYDDRENLRSLARVWMSLTNFSKPPLEQAEVNRRCALTALKICNLSARWAKNHNAFKYTSSLANANRNKCSLARTSLHRQLRARTTLITRNGNFNEDKFREIKSTFHVIAALPRESP